MENEIEQTDQNYYKFCLEQRIHNFAALQMVHYFLFKRTFFNKFLLEYSSGLFPAKNEPLAAAVKTSDSVFADLTLRFYYQLYCFQRLEIIYQLIQITEHKRSELPLILSASSALVDIVLTFVETSTSYTGKCFSDSKKCGNSIIDVGRRRYKHLFIRDEYL